MALLRSLTKEKSFVTYIGDVGLHAGVHLNNCIKAGLPSVWLYMKAIGLEQEFFDLIKRCKARPALNKELMYLLYMTNSNSDFIPQLPDDLLKLEIPRLVDDAQVEITKPDFKLVFGLTRERLIELLRAVATSNRMVRIASKSFAVGIMCVNGVYSVYHEGMESKAMEFTKLQDCADAVLKMQPKAAGHDGQMVVMESYNLAGMPVAKAPIVSDFFIKYAKQYSEAQMVDCLFTCVLANDLKSLELLYEMKVDFNVTKLGVNLLQLAVAQPQVSTDLIKFLIRVGVDRNKAIEELIAKKITGQQDAHTNEILELLKSADSRPHVLLHSIDAPIHQPTGPSRKG